MAELLEALRSGGVQAFSEATRAATRPASSIAVLPFTSVSGDGEQFGDGLAEELIHALSLYDDLQVIARTSAAAVRGLDIREIGRRLNVGVILDGSVRRAGNRLRIGVQLIDVNDGHQLWSERYDREMTDVFEVQDEITAAIIGKLRPQLLGGSSPSAARHSEDPEAYALYLKGHPGIVVQILRRTLGERRKDSRSPFSPACKLRSSPTWLPVPQFTLMNTRPTPWHKPISSTTRSTIRPGAYMSGTA